MADLEDYASISIVQLLPNSRDATDGDQLPRQLIGARIVNFGTGHVDVEGGGLIIDYVPAEAASRVERVVFAFNGHGMWIKWSSNRGSNQDDVR